VEGIDIMQISGHNNVAFINNYSTLSEERHKKIYTYMYRRFEDVLSKLGRVEKTERLIIDLNKLN
jgi:hypothetical protein